MSPTKVLLGQIAVVFGIVTLALMMATQWTASSLGYQAELGRPWTVLHGVPLYQPWQFFLWWFQFDAYAPDIFQRGAFVAASRSLRIARVRRASMDLMKKDSSTASTVRPGRLRSRAVSSASRLTAVSKLVTKTSGSACRTRRFSRAEPETVATR